MNAFDIITLVLSVFLLCMSLGNAYPLFRNWFPKAKPEEPAPEPKPDHSLKAGATIRLDVTKPMTSKELRHQMTERLFDLRALDDGIRVVEPGSYTTKIDVSFSYTRIR